MNRVSSWLLNLLLCALMVGLMSSTARAMTRPENRVWENFSSPLKSASEIASQPVDTRPENPGYGYDFASGVHKYLYCQADPVNGIDPTGLADYLLVLSYHGLSWDDQETKADWFDMGFYGNAFRGHTIAVTGILPQDDIYSVVSGKIGSKHLVSGTDRITKIIIVGHGSTSGEIGSQYGGPSDITLTSLQSKTLTPQLRLMNCLNPWTSGHCDVTLRACYQAVQGRPKEMMALMAQLLGANVTGWDDVYAVKGWGNAWTVDSKGNWTMTKGKPWKGSWADRDTWSAFLGGFLDGL